MKTIVINKVEKEIPESYEDVSIAMYKRIVEIKDIITEDLNNTQKTAALLSKILDIGIKEIYLTTVTEFNKAVEALAFLNEPIKPKELKTLTIEGDTYFIKKDLETLSVGEMISLEIYIQQNPTFIEMLAPSIALMLGRKLDNGELEEFDADRFALFISLIEQKVSITEAFGVAGFFLTSGKTYTTINSGNSLTMKVTVEQE